MSTTMSVNAADLIVPGARMSLGYLMSLTRDVPADRWADCAVETMNSPAFLYGHLAIYPNRVLAKFIDRPDLVIECPFNEEAVVAGAECLPDASLYPTMDVVLPFLQERYETVIDAVSGVTPEQWTAENPAEGRFREVLPTVGAAVSFMLNNHVMMHAGQVSHWRRAMGLGSAG
jgi:hypothetical protein